MLRVRPRLGPTQKGGRDTYFSDRRQSSLEQTKPRPVFWAGLRREEEIPAGPRERKGEARGPRTVWRAPPYRFNHQAALEILLVTTRQSRQWIIPKGWPIKGLRPAKSAAREAFEEAGVRGRVGAKSIGLFSLQKDAGREWRWA